jgi:general secretion pathway protein D
MVGPLILRDTPLDQILELVERYTGRVMLRPASLPPGTYTLTLDKPLPKADALRALETVLNLNGVGLSPLGDRFLKVSPLNLIRAEAPEFIAGPTLAMPPSGRVAAKLFTLEFLRVAEFVPQISQILSPALGAAPIVFEKNNAVLITDSISTLQRVEKLISTLDQPTAASLGVKTYTIANAKASDLVNKLRTLLSGPLATQIGTASTYQPDDRTNQIILIADKREHAFFDQLIAKLDAEASPNTRSEVIFLKHANATEVATLLSQLITGQTTASSRQGGSSGGGTRTTSQRNASGNKNAQGGAPATPPAPAAVAAVNAAAASEEFSSYLLSLIHI